MNQAIRESSPPYAAALAGLPARGGICLGKHFVDRSLGQAVVSGHNQRPCSPLGPVLRLAGIESAPADTLFPIHNYEELFLTKPVISSDFTIPSPSLITDNLPTGTAATLSRIPLAQ